MLMLRQSIFVQNLCRSNSANKFFISILNENRFSTNQSLRTSFKPHICVVGSGPAALYTTQYILKNLPNIEKTIDIYEKQPVPFGLVRYGIAPDHQDVKNVINSFSETLRNENVNFFGNISIGNDISIKELLNAYDCVVLAYGSHSENYLNIPGEKSANVISAKDFVSWYNGLPGAESFQINLSAKKAVIIGAGNVAIDIARILLSPIENLEKTDISTKALELIKETNQIEEITIVARRGILNAAFTIKELRELTKIGSIECQIDMANFEAIQIDKTLDKLARPRKRITEFMLKISQSNQTPSLSSKKLKIEFLKTPVRILSNDSAQVVGVEFQKNKYDWNFATSDVDLSNEDKLNALPVTAIDGEPVQTLPANLVIRSIGFKNVSIDKSIPFDKKTGVVLNNHGKVIDVNGLYCTGWIKRGPRGVILDTTSDAHETAKVLCSDLNNNINATNVKSGSVEIVRLLNERQIRFVDKHGWLRIDREEKRRGKAIGKPREKILKHEEMLDIALGS